MGIQPWDLTVLTAAHCATFGMIIVHFYYDSDDQNWVFFVISDIQLKTSSKPYMEWDIFI